MNPSAPRLNASFLRTAQGWPYLLAPLIPVAVALELAHAPATVIFAVSALGIIPTAALMGRATEELAARSGPGIGGFLNVTFGNAPELIIALFALGQGLQEVVKASIVGSILGNMLLVLGAAMLAGGLRRDKQTFNRTSAGVQMTMLMLAGGALVMPAIFELVEGKGLPAPGAEAIDYGGTVEHLSLAVAVVLMATYVIGLFFSMKTHRALFNPEYEEEDTWGWSVRTSVIALAIAGVLVGLMSEVLVGSITEASESIGLSEFFIGAIVVAIVGNAAEHWVAVLVAMKDKMDLAVNIAVGSSAQVALFVAPVLVLASFFLGPHPLALVFNGFELGAILLAILAGDARHRRRRVELVRGRPAARPLLRLRPSLLLRLMEALLLLFSFAVVLAGALLFTNAVEWIGHKLNVGEGAVGSILAAVGTAMPETLIAIVALLGAAEGSEDIAIGAIVGAPFLLGTLAMGLVGLFAYLYRDKREQGVELRAHKPTLERDLVFFLILFAIGGLLAWGPPAPLRIAVGIAFILAYFFYIALTLRGGGEVQEEESLNPLIFERRGDRREDPALALCVIQLLVGLGAMVGGAHLFVEELLHIAESIGVEALVLALILAPLATELPEKVNSFFWVREGKDALALGNITGAMVFQSMIPVGIGLIFTDWDLTWTAVLSIGLGVAGGMLAYESLHISGRFKLPAVIGWFVLYASFIAAVAISA